MAITIEQYKSLHKYLDNEMTYEEEAALEKELKTDAELKESYDVQVGLRNYLDLSELKRTIPNFSVKDLIIEEPVFLSLQIAHKRVSIAKTKYSNSKTWIFYAAACITFVIGSIFLHYYHSSTTQKIAKANVRKTDTPLSKQEDQSSLQEAVNNKTDFDNRRKKTEEKIDDQQKLLAIAQRYFSRDTIPNELTDELPSNLTKSAKNDKPVTEDSNLSNQHNLHTYASAISKNLDAISESKKIDCYNKGIDYMEKKLYKQAEKKLKWVIDNSNDENYIGNAKWYLALAYMMEGNTKAALPLLIEVSVNTSVVPYNKKASNLLKEISKK